MARGDIAIYRKYHVYAMIANADNFKPLNFVLEGRISMRPSRELDNPAASSKRNAFPI